MEAEGIDEKLRMLTAMLQNIVDDINVKLNIFKEEYSEAEDLKNETEKIKSQVKELRSLEWESRNRNIVIFGFKGEENENKLDTYNRVIDLFSKVLQVNFKDHQIDNLYWNGKRKHNRPLLIKFTNSLTKEYIMGRKGMFKGYKIRLENDYNPEICATRKKLVEYMWDARRRGKHMVLVGDKIRISGAIFDLQFCEKNFKTGVGNTKRRESRRVVVPQGSKYDIERIHKDIEKQEGERVIEEKVGGENKGKSKELGQKTVNGVGQQTEI